MGMDPNIPLPEYLGPVLGQPQPPQTQRAHALERFAALNEHGENIDELKWRNISDALITKQ